MSKLRPKFNSEGALHLTKKLANTTLSEGNLKPLSKMTHIDILCASNLLQRIVNESSGTFTRKKQEKDVFVDMNQGILNLVYETMKCTCLLIRNLF